MQNEEKLLDIIAEILEVETVTSQTLLDDGWDSLAVVTFISEVDTEFDVIVEPEKVGEAKSIADLIALL